MRSSSSTGACRAPTPGRLGSMTHFECYRPGQRNRSNFNRKIGLQSFAQKSLPGGGAPIFGASMPPRQKNSPAPGNELSIKWALCKKGYAQHFPLNAPCSNQQEEGARWTQVSPPAPSSAPRSPFPSAPSAMMNCADNTGAKNLYIISIFRRGARLNKIPAASIGDMTLCSIKKGKPEFRKKSESTIAVL